MKEFLCLEFIFIQVSFQEMCYVLVKYFCKFSYKIKETIDGAHDSESYPSDFFVDLIFTVPPKPETGISDTENKDSFWKTISSICKEKRKILDKNEQLEEEKKKISEMLATPPRAKVPQTAFVIDEKKIEKSEDPKIEEMKKEIEESKKEELKRSVEIEQKEEEKSEKIIEVKKEEIKKEEIVKIEKNKQEESKNEEEELDVDKLIARIENIDTPN